MEGFGPHVTVDGYNCSKEKLKDFHLVYRVLSDLPEMLGMQKMCLPYVVKWKDKWAKEEGVSGFVMIAESHISIHTFPEQGFFTADIYSCKKFDYAMGIEYFKKNFEIKEMQTNVIQRGTKFRRQAETKTIKRVALE